MGHIEESFSISTQTVAYMIISLISEFLRKRNKDFQTYWAYALLCENRDHVQSCLSDIGVASSQIHVRNDKYSMFKNSFRPSNTDWFDAREPLYLAVGGLTVVCSHV